MRRRKLPSSSSTPTREEVRAQIRLGPERAVNVPPTRGEQKTSPLPPGSETSPLPYLAPITLLYTGDNNEATNPSGSPGAS